MIGEATEYKRERWASNIYKVVCEMNVARPLSGKGFFLHLAQALDSKFNRSGTIFFRKGQYPRKLAHSAQIHKGQICIMTPI